LTATIVNITSDAAHLHGARGGNGDSRLGLAAGRALLLDGLDNVETLDDLAEDDVLAVEPVGHNGRDEELRAVCVGTSVGHGEQTGAGVLESEVLVSKLLAVDRLAASAVAVGEVTALEHEVGDDAVEAGLGVAVAVLASAELTEVAGSLGDNIVVELEDDAAEGATVAGDVEENVGHYE